MGTVFTGRAGTRLIGAVAALAVGGTLLAVTASEAGASTGSMHHTCPGRGTSQGDRTFSSTWDTNAPAVMYVGDAAVDLVVTGNISWDRAETSNEWWMGRYWGKGKAKPSLTVGGTSVTPAPELDVPRFNIPSSGVAIQKAEGSMGMFTPPAVPGDVPIVINNYDLPYQLYLEPNTLSLTHTYTCVNQGAPQTLDTIRIKSRSHTTLELAPIGGVYPGAAATATAVVTVDGGTPSGRVDFTAAGQTVSGTVGPDGRATVSLPTDLAPGDKQVTAVFVPTDADHYDASTSNTANLKIKAPVATTTALSMPATTLAPGEAGEINVLVSAPEGTPAGSVTVTVNDQTWTAVLDAGSASFPLPSLPMGAYEASAVYTAVPGQHTSSSTANVTRFWVQGNSQIQLDDPVPVREDAEAQLVARVTADGDSSAGKVNFQVGGTTYPANVVDGIARTTIGRLAAGLYTVEAEYVPASGLNLRGAVSDGKNLIVTELPVDPTGPTDPTDPVAENTTLKLTSTSAGLAYGQKASLVAVLGQAAAGQVTFTVGGRSSTVAVVAGQALFTTPVLTAGSHQVTAVFTPTDRAAWKASSARAVLKVTQDKVSGKLTSKRVVRTGKVTGTLTLSAAHRTVVSGKATLTISGAGVKKKTITVTVVRGKARFTFAGIRKPYALKLVFGGTKNLAAVTVKGKGK